MQILVAAGAESADEFPEAFKQLAVQPLRKKKSHKKLKEKQVGHTLKKNKWRVAWTNCHRFFITIFYMKGFLKW